MFENQTAQQVRGLGGALTAPQAQLQAAQYAMKNEQQPPAATVRSLLDIAYQQIEALENEIGRLGEQLLPVRELSPCKESGESENALGVPEVIGMLRGLIDRIARQQAVVRSISNEVRI
jgi:hypothetical protein